MAFVFFTSVLKGVQRRTCVNYFYMHHLKCFLNVQRSNNLSLFRFSLDFKKSKKITSSFEHLYNATNLLRFDKVLHLSFDIMSHHCDNYSACNVFHLLGMNDVITG